MNPTGGRKQVQKALAAHEPRVAELIAQGASIDQIVGQIGLRESAGIRSGLSRAITDQRGHPSLAEAMKRRIEARVKKNQERLSNTTVNEIAKSTGMGFLKTRDFVRVAGIPLVPIVDVDAARIA
ncbi:MAG: hypothetical protein V1703_00480, partial [Candidatus Altiarchaeota archaeon]